MLSNEDVKGLIDEARAYFQRAFTSPRGDAEKNLYEVSTDAAENFLGSVRFFEPTFEEKHGPYKSSRLVCTEPDAKCERKVGIALTAADGSEHAVYPE